MRSRTTRVTGLIATTILIAALAVPAVAGAAPAPAATPVAMPVVQKAAAQSAAKAAATEQLKLKIAETLRLRAASFSAATSSLTRRINSLSAIANRLAKAGGNVKPARKSIAAAKKHLAKARTLEKQTVASFKAVVSANDRAAAFDAARKKGRLATAQLKLAQADVRKATVQLRAVVKKLEKR
jgi:hypothetical protein